MDTLAGRWEQLKPYIQVVGPEGRRPTVLMFHGCGGKGEFMKDYARAAAEMGVRSVIVDSFAPRGWSDAFATVFVCAGMLLWGRERAGDVLAASFGAVRDLDADPDQLLLAGWSHGGWSVMDLMTMPLQTPGEAGLADPSPAPLAGLKGLFLAYPYGGVATLSRRGWVRSPKVLAVMAERDMVTSVRDATSLYAAIRGSGAEVDVWSAAGGAHAFDEYDSPMARLRYKPELAAEALSRFRSFLAETVVPA